jgi:outer membrane protein TolC
MTLLSKNSLQSILIAGACSLGFIASIQADTMKIDLASALKLADEKNTTLAIQVEKSKQATLAVQQAWLQWVPTVRFGISSAHQDGLLQETDGNLINAERNGRFDGFGLGGLGSGLAQKPGFSTEVDLAKSVFEPLAAKQRKIAVDANAEASRLNVLLDVSVAYYELAKASRGLVLAKKATRNAKDLAEVTSNFAESGEALVADSERVAVESLIQQQKLESSKSRLIEASSHLASLLQLEGDIQLEPETGMIATLSLAEKNSSLDELIAQAREKRPELRGIAAIRKAAEAENRQNGIGLLLPKVGASYSSTDFGGGLGSNNNLDGNRDETAVAVYWELDQLGLGSMNKSRIQKSKLREAEALERQAQTDIVARVTRAFAQWKSAERQLDLAKNAVTRARNAYQLSRERIYENQGLPLEALQAMKSLAETESMYLEAAANYNIAQLELISSTGQKIAL